MDRGCLPVLWLVVIMKGVKTKMCEKLKFAHEMRLLKPVHERSTVSLVPYTSKYQKAYKQMYNACYHKMREILDIHPYDYIQDDSFFDSGMDSVYLFIKDGLLVGSVALKENEIDDLIVAPKFQGCGIGREILLWALEHISSEPVVLHVAEWNKRVIRLYRNCGFEITNTFDIS